MESSEGGAGHASSGPSLAILPPHCQALEGISNVNEADPFARTALLKATVEGRLPVVEFLLEQKADPNRQVGFSCWGTGRDGGNGPCRGFVAPISATGSCLYHISVQLSTPPPRPGGPLNACMVTPPCRLLHTSAFSVFCASFEGT